MMIFSSASAHYWNIKVLTQWQSWI
jgi:hypothetical protein